MKRLKMLLAAVKRMRVHMFFGASIRVQRVYFFRVQRVQKRV